MSDATEQKIISLCSKVISTHEPDECTVAVRELKKALHEHLSEIREKVADLAVVISSKNESRATPHPDQ